MAEAKTDPMAALDEAIETCGKTVAAFASAISTSDLPVQPNKVSMWRARGSVPPEYVPAIFRETARRGRPITPERFQPRIDWEALRMQAGDEAKAA